ncbi:MAG: HigA family addiction module antidote protein [Gracilimonas sp.]|uniref:HigA family addiction module antitoxin n=1 Tax=Gracilimonas sp. TaxID=1974203 RepID=UPI00199E9388|nr:HigA family addiction module antitoxin [Gracilimonas sp.]MBD3617285.1 HigA family addiction module antidote protein [Gracilimonas sp.]
MNTDKKVKPIHPGKILLEEYLEPLNISQREFARRISVSPNRVNEIVRGRRTVTGDTALRFSIALGTSAEMWLGLQAHYELGKARKEMTDEVRESIVKFEGELQ